MALTQIDTKETQIDTKETKIESRQHLIDKFIGKIKKILRYKTLNDVLADPDSNTAQLNLLGISTVNCARRDLTDCVENRFQDWEDIEKADLDLEKIKTLWKRGWIESYNEGNAAYSIETLEKVKDLDLGKLEKYHEAGLNFWLPALFDLDKIDIDEKKIPEFARRKICIDNAERLDEKTDFPFNIVEKLSKRGKLDTGEINKLIRVPNYINLENVEKLENALGIKISLYTLFNNEKLDQCRLLSGYDLDDLGFFKKNKIKIDDWDIPKFQGEKIKKENFEPFINAGIEIPSSSIVGIQRYGGIKKDEFKRFIYQNDPKLQEIILQKQKDPTNKKREELFDQRREYVTSRINTKMNIIKTDAFEGNRCPSELAVEEIKSTIDSLRKH